MNPIVTFKRRSVSFSLFVLLVVLVIGCSSQELTPAAVASKPVTSERGVLIQNRGTILVGVCMLHPMSFFQDNDYQGFEIDLAREIVQRLFGNDVAIEWVPTTAYGRFEAVGNDQVDFLIRVTTHTITREDLVAFTSNYFGDGIRLLVRRGEGHTGIESMNGKTIRVDSFTTTSQTSSVSVVRQAAADAGVDATIEAGASSYSLSSGTADAVAADWTHHHRFTGDYDAHQAVGGLFSSEPLAIAVSKNDLVFRDEIDAALLEIISDGTWQTLYDRWFPDPPPWTLEEMLAMPPVDDR